MLKQMADPRLAGLLPCRSGVYIQTYGGEGEAGIFLDRDRQAVFEVKDVRPVRAGGNRSVFSGDSCGGPGRVRNEQEGRQQKGGPARSARTPGFMPEKGAEDG